MKNFQLKIEALQRQLHWWKARDLSLQGRIFIIKSIALPKFQYLASLITIPDQIIQKVNSTIYEFVWKGKTDKVKRLLLEQNYEKGGLKMYNLTHIIKSASIMWVKRYLDNIDRIWKHTFEHFCQCKNLNLFLRCNFNHLELPFTLPNHYKSVIENWSKMSCTVGKNRIVGNDTYVWYNNDIKIAGKTLYDEHLFRAGLWTISDLYNGGNIIPFEVWRNRGATENNRLLWGGVVNIVRKKNMQVDQYYTSIPCGLRFDNDVSSIQKVTQKHIKDFIITNDYLTLSEHDKKYIGKSNQLFGPIETEEWHQIFELIQLLPIDNKSRELQYKIIMRFVPTNSLLYKMDKIESHRCTFCMLGKETIEHLFYECTHVKNVIFFVLAEWKRLTNEDLKLSLRECILGKIPVNDVKDIAINMILICLKQFIMRCKYGWYPLTNQVCKTILRNVIKVWCRTNKKFSLDVLNDLFET